MTFPHEGKDIKKKPPRCPVDSNEIKVLVTVLNKASLAGHSF